MTSSEIQTKVQELFKLDKNEKTLNDFNCFLVESFPILGQLYLTEHYICFYSDLIFFNRNIIICTNEIMNITLNKENKNIEIEIKHKGNLKKYKFFSNTDIINIYNIIKPSFLLDSQIIEKENSETILRKFSQSISRKSTELSISSLSRKTSNELSSSSLSIENILNEETSDEIKFSSIEEEVDFEICRKIININPKDLFNKYFTNSCPETCYQKFYEFIGDHSNVEISEWEKTNNKENSGIEQFKRTEQFYLSLHGIPFVDHSEITKTSIYYIEKDGTYYIHNSTKNEGIPSSDCFTIEATIELHPYNNGKKTVFRTYVRTNFIKSTFFKSLLISQTKKSYTEEVDKWLEFLQEKGDKIEGDYVYIEKIINKSLNLESNANMNKSQESLSKKNNNEKIENINSFNKYNDAQKLGNLGNIIKNKAVIITVLFLCIIINYFLLFQK